MAGIPGSAQETSEYDQVGNLVKTVNATSLQIRYQYGALHLYCDEVIRISEISFDRL
jgi:hypothetical protein